MYRVYHELWTYPNEEFIFITPSMSSTDVNDCDTYPLELYFRIVSDFLRDNQDFARIGWGIGIYFKSKVKKDV